MSDGENFLKNLKLYYDAHGLNHPHKSKAAGPWKHIINLQETLLKLNTDLCSFFFPVKLCHIAEIFNLVTNKMCCEFVTKKDF